MKKNLLLAALLCAPVVVMADEAPAQETAQAEQAVCRCENDCNCLDSRANCTCVNRGDGDNDGGCGGVCGKNMQCADTCDKECAEETTA